MSNIRQVVVVRKDLQLSPGLLAAQVAHISDAFMREKIRECYFEKETELPWDKPKAPSFERKELEWCKDPYLSVLAVNCWEDLEELIRHVEGESLNYTTWDDLIPSPTIEGKSIRADIGISIGPDDFDRIKIVTGSLPLY